MNNNKYIEDYLRKPFLKACNIGNLEIIKFLMTSKTFTPNTLSVRGVENIFREKHEEVINWLIFDYNVFKSGAIEEVFIEMRDQIYAKHIESLFEKREINKNLNNQLNDKNIISLKTKI